MITIDFFRKETLKELVKIYIKCIFVENYFSVLFLYKNSTYGDKTCDYYWQSIKRSINSNDLNLINSIFNENEINLIAKQSIDDILSKISSKKDVIYKIYDTFYVGESFKSNIINNINEQNLKFNKFGDQNKQNNFFFEYFLKINQNNLTLNDKSLQNVVNVNNFLNFIQNISNDDVKTYFSGIQYGLRLCFNVVCKNPINPGEKSLLDKSYWIYDPIGYVYTPIPIIEKYKTINFSSKDHLINILNNNIEQYNRNLKLEIIISDESDKLFSKIIPLNILDIIFACQFHNSTKLFNDILKINKFYEKSSEFILKSIKSLINHKEIQ